jgi:hypothetical protein
MIQKEVCQHFVGNALFSLIFKFTLHVSYGTYSVLSADCLEGGRDCGIRNIGVDHNM